MRLGPSGQAAIYFPVCFADRRLFPPAPMHPAAAPQPPHSSAAPQPHISISLIPQPHSCTSAQPRSLTTTAQPINKGLDAPRHAVAASRPCPTIPAQQKHSPRCTAQNPSEAIPHAAARRRSISRSGRRCSSRSPCSSDAGRWCSSRRAPPSGRACRFPGC